MFQRCKLLGILTPNQGELLKALFEFTFEAEPATFRAPCELGAYRSSHHHNTLKTLVEQGLVEQQELSRTTAGRPRFGYRISEMGRIAWLEFVHLSEVEVNAIPGRPNDRARAARTIALTSQ